jgi:reactive intermediate/imine deaminase
VPGGIEAETRQVLANMQAILERHGTSLENVVQCTVYLVDLAEWPAFNAVYTQFFTKNLPARSAIGAAALVRGARVEVDCVAFVPAAKN